MKKKRSNKWWIWILVIVILVGAGIYYRAYASNKSAQTTEVQTATVSRGSLSSTLSSSGTARAEQNATISWQTTGKVGDVSVALGDLVQEDQVLAALDTEQLSTEMINAKTTLISAQQALDDLLNSKLAQAQALQAVEDAQNALDSLKQKAAESSSQALVNLEAAKETLQTAQKTRIALDYPRDYDKLVVEKAYTDYLMAKEAYKEAMKEFNKWANKKLTDPRRAQALTRVVSTKQAMDTKFAIYNWYLLEPTELEIAQADADLALAQVNLDTAQAAWDSAKNGTSEASIALYEAQLNDALREWERVKDGPTEDDVAAAQAAVDTAQAALDHAQLLAPFAGTITQLNVSSGDLVSSGENAFRIDDMATIYIDLQISEVDLQSLKVGQKATIEFDALPDKSYEGEVTEIGIIGTSSQGVVNYPVTVKVINDGNIRPGMTASVTIVVDERADVLLVPSQAVRTTSGQKMVTVLFEGQQITVPVTIGLNNGSMVEITSSQLLEGDVVVLNGSTTGSTTTNQSGNFREFGGDFGGPPDGGIMIINP